MADKQNHLAGAQKLLSQLDAALSELFMPASEIREIDDAIRSAPASGKSKKVVINGITTYWPEEEADAVTIATGSVPKVDFSGEARDGKAAVVFTCLSVIAVSAFGVVLYDHGGLAETLGKELKALSGNAENLLKIPSAQGIGDALKNVDICRVASASSDRHYYVDNDLYLRLDDDEVCRWDKGSSAWIALPKMDEDKAMYKDTLYSWDDDTLFKWNDNSGWVTISEMDTEDWNYEDYKDLTSSSSSDTNNDLSALGSSISSETKVTGNVEVVENVKTTGNVTLKATKGHKIALGPDVGIGPNTVVEATDGDCSIIRTTIDGDEGSSYEYSSSNGRTSSSKLKAFITRLSSCNVTDSTIRKGVVVETGATVNDGAILDPQSDVKPYATVNGGFVGMKATIREYARSLYSSIAQGSDIGRGSLINKSQLYGVTSTGEYVTLQNVTTYGPLNVADRAKITDMMTQGNVTVGEGANISDCNLAQDTIVEKDVNASHFTLNQGERMTKENAAQIVARSAPPVEEPSRFNLTEKIQSAKTYIRNLIPILG